MKSILLKTFALSLVVALAAFGGCSDDDPAAPPGGGGGGGGFSLPAGVYNTSFAQTVCGNLMPPGRPSVEVWCSDEVVDEINDFDCKPTMLNADTILIDCSGTEVVDDTCTVDWMATGIGWRAEDKWTLEVKVEVVDDPEGCYDGPTCLDIVMSAERTGDRPEGCNYADANTFNATITGGPMGGNVPFEMYGGSTPDTGGIRWNFSGNYPPSESPRGPGVVQSRHQSIGFGLEAIDPQSLPFPADVDAGGTRQGSAGQAGGYVWYDEYDLDYSANAIGGGGTVTVNVLTNMYIAGSIDLDVDMSEHTGPRTSAAQDPLSRTITGRFFVVRSEVNAAQQGLGATLAQRMLRSLRSYVE